MVTDSEGVTRKVYEGAQSTECCVVTSACMANEGRAINSVCFKLLRDFAIKFEQEGIPARGDEPAFPPQVGGLVGCGTL